MNEIIKRYVELGDEANYSVPELVISFLQTDRTQILEVLKNSDLRPVTKSNIPQYSSFTDGSYDLIRYLRMSGDFGPSFTEIGKHFLDDNQKASALIKYGENHAKLAESLGLVYIRKEGRVSKVYLSELGKCIEKMDDYVQRDLIAKLSINIPIIAYCLKNDIDKVDELFNLLKEYLTETTAVRRRKNTWDIVKMFRGI